MLCPCAWGNTMGIEILEERFQDYKQKYPEHLSELASLAGQIAGHQQRIRKLLGKVTPTLCARCTNTCCSGIPCDGWFSTGDYFAYRMLYDVPEMQNAGSRSEWVNWSCSFLTDAGCSLPEDMRPLACIKVNCANLNRILEERGDLPEFRRICEAIDLIQTRLWELVAEHQESWAGR